MTAIAVLYASAPSGEVILPTIEIRVAGREPLRVVNGFEDQVLGVDGVYHLFTAAPLSLSLPKKDTSGTQKLNFGVGNVTGQIQEYVDAALESGEYVPLIYREYSSADKSAPASKPYAMTLKGGTLEATQASFEASFYDMLNHAWPRQRYTAENAPGLKYA